MGDPFPSLAWIMKPVKNERFQMVRHIQSMYEFKEKPTRYIINGAHLATVDNF